MATLWSWKHGNSLSLDDLSRSKKASQGGAVQRLWQGCLGVDAEAVKRAILLLQPGEVNSKDSFDDTPLHAASNSAPIVELLLQAGAAVNYRNKLKVTPLHRSCADGNLAAAKLLVTAGAAINATDDFLNTPLHYACARRRFSCAVFLLDSGCDLECKNMKGHTPLLVALVEGQLELVRMLLKRGANKRVVDACGKTGHCLVRENRKMSKELQQNLMDEIGGMVSVSSSLSVSLRGSRWRALSSPRETTISLSGGGGGGCMKREYGDVMNGGDGWGADKKKVEHDHDGSCSVRSNSTDSDSDSSLDTPHNSHSGGDGHDDDDCGRRMSNLRQEENLQFLVPLVS